MAFVSTVVLVIVLIFRPHEIWTALNKLHLLDTFTALALVGVGVDFLLRKTPVWRTREKRPDMHLFPQLPFLLGFLAMAYVTSAIFVGRQGLVLATTRAVIAAVFMVVVVYGVRTPANLKLFVGLLVLLAASVATVAIHQGRQEPSCIEIDPFAEHDDDDLPGEPDGRTCQVRGDCVKGGRGDMDYECERLGKFGTFSVERRVKWRGQLNDPNELSVYLGGCIPFLLAAMGLWRKWPVRVLCIALMGMLIYAIILTGSRGGQLVVAIVFSVFFVRRFGWKGLVIAALFAAPVLLLGGRSGENADSSADERQGILFDAIGTFMKRPYGSGIDQFTEDHHLTAHNAYVLAAVDLGFLGFLSWIGLLWTSFKVPYAIMRRPAATVDPSIRALAYGLMVSLIGVAFGIFFLSFTYKQLLFVFFGVAGGLYGAMKNHDPTFEVKIGPKDLFGLIFGGAFLLLFIFVYTRLNPK